MTKAQRLVNLIDQRFGLDSSELTDKEIDSLIEHLEELKECDREDCESPSDEDMDEFAPADFEEDEEDEDY